MKKIIVILAILNMSCQAQEKKEMNQDKIGFYPNDLIYLKNIPQQDDILSITFKKGNVSSNIGLNTSLFKIIIDHDNTRILNPNNELDAKLLTNYSYSPWYVVDITTVKGNYKITLFLGGLGFMTLPNGKKGAILFDLSELKIKEDERLLSNYKKIKRKVLSTQTDDEDVKDIELKLGGKIITYNINEDAIKINNIYPHPSKEFNENIHIHQYVIKPGNSKVYFWKGNTQISETDNAYPKLVADYIATTEILTTQQGAYSPTMRLMEDNVLVFPDGLKMEISLFSHKRTFDTEESVVIVYLEISENQGEEHVKISVRLSKEKDEQGRLVTTYESIKWRGYKIELTELSYNNYIDIIVSKNRETKINDIKKLGKDSIIQLALDIAQNDIDKDYFETIAISANHQEIYVNFYNSVVYAPLNKEFTTGFTVSILGRTTSYNSIANPTDLRMLNERKYYNPNDKENKKVIQFIFDAINKSTKIGNVNLNNLDGGMTIKEQDTYYDILVVSDSQESNYKIKKETGEVYDAMHAHLSKIPLPIEEGEEEIKDLTYYFRNQINAKSCVSTEILKKTFVELKNNILKNSKSPVFDEETFTKRYSYVSTAGILFEYMDEAPFLETVTINDTKLAITYNLFFDNKEQANQGYDIGSSKYSEHFNSKRFDEQRHKDIVAHFCKNIVNKDF